MNSAPLCPTCGKRMVLRNGAYGDFFGCSGYPDCTTTVNIDDVDSKFGQASNWHDGESYGSCSRCGSTDTLSEMGYCSYCQHVWDQD